MVDELKTYSQLHEQQFVKLNKLFVKIKVYEDKLKEKDISSELHHNTTEELILARSILDRLIKWNEVNTLLP